MKNSLFICLMFVGLTILITNCAQYKYVGTRFVEGYPKKQGPVADSLIQYSPLKVTRFPDETSQVLEVSLKKEIDITIQYNQYSHTENIYQKSPSLIEEHAEDLVDNFEISPAIGIIHLGFWPVFVLLDALTGKEPYKPKKYEDKPGTDSLTITFKQEQKTVPAIGETLISSESDTVITNENGIAQFYSDPSRFDSGVKITHVETRDSYIVKRILKERTVKGEWVAPSKFISNIVGTAVTIKKLKNMFAAGAGPPALVVAVAVDVLTGAVIGYIIEQVGTTTEQYYQWVLVRAN